VQVGVGGAGDGEAALGVGLPSCCVRQGDQVVAVDAEAAGPAVDVFEAWQVVAFGGVAGVGEDEVLDGVVRPA